MVTYPALNLIERDWLGAVIEEWVAIVAFAI